MPEFLLNPSFLIMALVSVIITILYFRERDLRKTSNQQGQQILENADEKSYKVLHSAIKKAQTILSMAELEGIKVLAQSKLSSGKLDKQYSQKLEDSIENTQSTIHQEVDRVEKSILQAEQDFQKFLDDLKSSGEKKDTEALELTKYRINQLLEKLEEQLTQFLFTTEQKTTQSIELEIKAARQLIETYKTQQLNLIDENIISILEQTLSLVLAKKLTLRDQVDLVYEALEKAKVEKFIV